MLEDVYHMLRDAGQPTVCVVGDAMLDTYVWGAVSRISPEGPIPVLHVQRREHRLGGALSVAAMLRSLQARVLPVGVVGDDRSARLLRARLQESDIEPAGLLRESDRPTATKTRYLGYVQSAGRALQQLLRVDEEDTSPVSEHAAAEVLRHVHDILAEVDLLVVQDMGKGLFMDSLLREVLSAAGNANVPVIVDPERTQDYAPYARATCVVPNRFEAEMATGMQLRSEAEFADAASVLLAELDLDSVVIKLDRDGIYYATRRGESQHIRAHQREVADVTGAGDMVAAALALALGSGAEFDTAVRFANFAGGLEVMQSGATPIPRARLMEALQSATDPVATKIRDRCEVASLVERLRGEGKSIAFTNGCFDLLHLGHVRLVQYARRQGDVLIVGLNSDASTRAIKGPDRPINNEQVRSHVLASLADVDYVIVFDEQSVLPLIREIRPDVLVKGGDYPKEGVVGHEFVESYGGEVRLAPLARGLSTTELINRIAQSNERSDPQD